MAALKKIEASAQVQIDDSLKAKMLYGRDGRIYVNKAHKRDRDVVKEVKRLCKEEKRKIKVSAVPPHVIEQAYNVQETAAAPAKPNVLAQRTVQEQKAVNDAKSSGNGSTNPAAGNKPVKKRKVSVREATAEEIEKLEPHPDTSWIEGELREMLLYGVDGNIYINKLFVKNIDVQAAIRRIRSEVNKSARFRTVEYKVIQEAYDRSGTIVSEDTKQDTSSRQDMLLRWIYICANRQIKAKQPVLPLACSRITYLKVPSCPKKLKWKLIGRRAGDLSIFRYKVTRMKGGKRQKTGSPFLMSSRLAKHRLIWV